MHDDERSEWDDLLDLAFELTRIDATVLKRLAAALARLGKRVQVEIDLAGGGLLPGEADFEQALRALRREVRVLAESRGVELPAWQTNRAAGPAAGRAVPVLSEVVEQLAYLGVRPEFA